VIGLFSPRTLTLRVGKTNNGDSFAIGRNVKPLIDETIHGVHDAAHLVGDLLIGHFNSGSKSASKYRHDRHELILS
jgi:hypothetical protein